MPKPKTAHEIREEMRVLQDQLTEAVKQEAALNNGDPKAVADVIHQKTCHSNHIDQCGYEYESWDKPGYSKTRYLDSANRLIAKAKSLGVPVSSLLEVVGWSTDTY